MTYPVKWYDSTMQGAPALSGQAGKLIDVLDACLINGFGTLTLDSLVVSGAVATATKSTGHAYLQHSVIEIAGASPSGLNGEKRVLSVTATTFTFDATGISDQTASGTITAKVPAMGWTKAFSGTNKAVYARSDVQATAMRLRVVDDQTTYATSQMYESMTDVDTGAGPTPTSGYLYTGKTVGSDLAWVLVSDSRTFYLFINRNAIWDSGLAFGDLISYKSGDAYACAIAAGPLSDYKHVLSGFDTIVGAYIARSYTQIGACVASRRYSHVRCPVASGLGGMSYDKNPVSNAVHCAAIEAWETTALARGLWPGLLCPVHHSSPASGTKVHYGSDCLLIQQSYASDRRMALSLFGPWR